MSIQPVPSSSFGAEPAVQRRPAPGDAGGERESFVLPREEPVQDATPPARESRREMASDVGEARRDAAEARRDAGDARRASEEATAASEKPSNSAVKPAVQPAAAETGAKAPATETGKPAGKASDAAPATQPPAPNLDIAALVSIAIAAQAENQPAKTGEIGEAKGETTEGEAGAAASEPKAEGIAVAVTPVPPAVLLAPPVSVPTLPTNLAAAAADSGEESDLLSGKKGAGTAAAALSLMAAREAKAALASGADVSAAATAGAASKNGSSSPAKTLPLPVGADQAAKPEAAPDGGDKLAQPLAQAQGPAAQTAPPSDIKSIDALQQALNPIDLSALGLQGGAKPEPLRILTMPDQIGAQQAAVATQPQGATEGPPTPLHVLPIEIGLRALAGARQFDIRLDPGELGRVDVNLSISDKGEVTARMVVDRVETLHLLQRDARTLERAFEQAGLKPSDAGVDITLRDPSDQSGFRQNRQQDEAPQRGRVFANGSEAGDDTAISTQPAPASRFVRLGGVDLSI